MLKTERLVIRPLQTRDAAGLYALNANPAVLRFTGDEPFRNREEAFQFIQNYQTDSSKGMGRWAVLKKSNGEFIGFCGLKNHPSFVDLGFRFLEKEWGRGYATEAAKATIQFGFDSLGISEVIGRCMPENVASKKVLEKLGFAYFKSDSCNGMPNAAWFKLTKMQWEIRQ